MKLTQFAAEERVREINFTKTGFYRGLQHTLQTCFVRLHHDVPGTLCSYTPFCYLNLRLFAAEELTHYEPLFTTPSCSKDRWPG